MITYVLHDKIEDQMKLLDLISNPIVRKKLLEDAQEQLIIDKGYRILRLVDGAHVYYVHLTSVLSKFAIPIKEMYARVSELEYISKVCIYKHHNGEW